MLWIVIVIGIWLLGELQMNQREALERMMEEQRKELEKVRKQLAENEPPSVAANPYSGNPYYSEEWRRFLELEKAAFGGEDAELANEE